MIVALAADSNHKKSRASHLPLLFAEFAPAPASFRRTDGASSTFKQTTSLLIIAHYLITFAVRLPLAQAPL